MAAKMIEEEADVSPTHELIRISQSRFTVSDLSRMEKIISEKLCLDPKAVTALTFLQLYHSAIASQSAGRYASPPSSCCWNVVPLCTELVKQVVLYEVCTADHVKFPYIFEGRRSQALGDWKPSLKPVYAGLFSLKQK